MQLSNRPNKKIFAKHNIPNMLLVLRMLMVPAIVVLLICDFYLNSKVVYSMKSLFDKQYYCDITVLILVAGILFVLASFTDFLDGYLARKYHWVSDFGKFWDPVADKVLINSTLICLTWHGMVPVFIPVIMIARDVIVDAKRMMAAKDNIVVAANIYGKMKTVLQMLGIIFILFVCCGSYFGVKGCDAGMWWGIQNFVLYAATIISVLSGVIYFIQINKAKHGKQN